MKQLSIWEYLQRLLLTLLVVSLFVILLMVAWAIVDALILLFIGVVTAVILRTLAKPIARYTPLNIKAAILIVILLLLVLLALGGWLFVPEIVNQTEALVTQVNQAIIQLEQFLLQYNWGQDLLETIFRQDPTQLPFQDLFPRVTDTFSLTVETLTNFFFILFIGLFLAWNPELYRSGIIRLIPPMGRKRAREVIDAIIEGLRGWLLGQFISMCTIGLVVGVGLSILGIPLAFLLGIISGVLEFVPILGPIVSSIPGILIAFTLGFTNTIYVTLFYLVVQQIEGNLLTPIVQRHTVDLPPALTLTVIFIMGLLFGPFAIFIATPLAATFLILIKMVYLEDVLKSR
ncbi:MAG: AI-2E family transporter [Spirulinaceae cyanobacterium]